MSGINAFIDSYKRLICKCLVLLILFSSFLAPTAVQADACSHSKTEWRTDWETKDAVTGLVYQWKTCSACGEQISSRTKAIDMYENRKFVFTPREFSDRFENMCNYFNKKYNILLLSDSDGGIVLPVYDKNLDFIAAIHFTDNSNILKESKKDTADIQAIMLYCYTENTNDIVSMMLSVILACDTTLDKEAAADIGEWVLSKSVKGKPHYHNGISYAVAQYDSKTLFVASLLNESSEIKITQQPSNATAKVGEIAKTSVKASGKGLTYAWYVKDPDAPAFTKSSNTTKTYSFKMTEAKSGRKVYCIITDANGVQKITNTVTLKKN